jgi:hypothetical protein
MWSCRGCIGFHVTTVYECCEGIPQSSREVASKHLGAAGCMALVARCRFNGRWAFPDTFYTYMRTHSQQRAELLSLWGVGHDRVPGRGT